MNTDHVKTTPVSLKAFPTTGGSVFFPPVVTTATPLGYGRVTFIDCTVTIGADRRTDVLKIFLP